MTEIIKDDIYNATSNITNNDALREKIHELHNYMRNNGIGYGMNSLKVFNLLYGLKKIDELNLYDKIGLTEENCKWSYLVKLANNKDRNFTVASVIDEIILEKIYDSKCKSSILVKLLGYEIPRDLKSDVFNHLINEIDNIPKLEKSSGELLSGKIYEYFVGRDQSAISELGAYFTNRQIVNHILTKINIDLNSDGSIPKMIDMFGGSGGFTLGYINYLNSNFKIDWTTQLNNIYHFDINQDIIKSVALEFFCLSNGIIPNIHNSSGNLRRINSFKWDYEPNNKFKLILTNPPYGGDKIITSAKKEKRDKIIQYIQNEINVFRDKLSKIVNDKKIKSIDKLIELVPDLDKNEVEKIKARELQLAKLKKEEKIEKEYSQRIIVKVNTCSSGIQKFAGKYKLTGNDKEACSLMLIMDLLDINGTAVGVLKEGLFFDSKYSDLRRVLIENFNVKQIISVPQNQFENTSTKTSIIIFNNDGDIKTSVINFSELIVDTYDKDEFIEINNEIFLKFNKGDIKEVREEFIKSVSVNQILANEYFSLNSKNYNKLNIECSNDFKLVKIKDICEFYKYKSQKNDIDGIYNYYSCSNIIKKCNNPNIFGEYILLGSRGIITDVLHYINGNFGCNDNMLLFNSTKINNKYIYIIINIIKKEINNNITCSTIPMISKEKFQEIEIPIPKTQELIDYWIDKIYKPFNLKLEKENRFKELEEEIKMKIKDIQENSECEDVKLGDIIIYVKKTNKFKAKDGNNNGKYNFYTSSQNNILFRDDYEFDNKYIIIGRGGNYSLHIDKYFSVSHDDVYVIDIKNIKIDYIYYYLYYYNNLLSSTFSGSTIKHTSKSKLEEIKIKIPKDKSLIDNLEPLFNEIEELHKEIKEFDKTYNNYIQELAKSAINNYNYYNDNINNDNNDEEIKSVKSNKSLTVLELKEQCKSLGIKGYSKKTKDELIEIIKNHK